MFKATSYEVNKNQIATESKVCSISPSFIFLLTGRYSMMVIQNTPFADKNTAEQIYGFAKERIIRKYLTMTIRIRSFAKKHKHTCIPLRVLVIGVGY